MIYTLTLNPSVDHYVSANVITGATNRAAYSRVEFGGKGINVTLALKNLGMESTALFFAGGFTGDGLTAYLTSKGVKFRYVKTGAETRINTKITSGGTVTEINAPGKKISAAELGRFLSLLSDIGRKDVAVISGSAPACDTDIVKETLEKLRDTGAKLICDMHGADLKKCLEYKPYLIKPNLEEAAGFFGKSADPALAEEYAKKLSLYARYVILSLGELGAYLGKDGSARYLPVIDSGREVRNTVGSGDSMIAGALYAEHHGEDILVSAVAAGSATAYSDGLCDMNTFEEVKRLYKKNGG